MDLKVYRTTNRIMVNPFSFDAGKGPGIETVPTILALAKAAGCGMDYGTCGGPMFFTDIHELNDADLTALLKLAQIIPER